MVVLLCLATASVLVAQEPGVHYLHQGAMPPGAIGSRQLQRGGPLPGFFQPVEIKAPLGASISLAVAGNFDRPQMTSRRAGFLIGQVYRLRVMNIPMNPGLEVFPTIEVIDRLYTPRNSPRHFAISIELTEVDLRLALAGKYVTRVIYLEDPNIALPIGTDPAKQDWFEVGRGQDPLAVADALGRPVAILRMGARIPHDDAQPSPSFLFGSPPFVPHGPSEAALPAKEQPPEQPQP